MHTVNAEIVCKSTKHEICMTRDIRKILCSALKDIYILKSDVD